MVMMIPPILGDDSPPGEIALYQALANVPDCDDWVALHSLRLAQHPHQQRGEADFVVVVPGHGVAVIEVKSHRSVARNAKGMWRLGRSAPSLRSPFAQADTAKFAIGEYLNSKMGLTAVHFEAGVWFTHVPAKRELPESVEWFPWQVLDITDLERDVPGAILRLLAEGRANRAATGYTWPAIVGPSQAQARAIVASLKPHLHVAPSPKDVQAAREQELARLLDEQVQVLDGLSDNHQLLVTGPPGCGKTFLALEAARRESARGRRGLLLCFNHALARYLRAEAADIEGLTVHTLPQLMLDITGVPASLDTDREFWESTLPMLAWAELLAAREIADAKVASRTYPQVPEAVDYLIVDEVQDLCRENWLEVVDQLVVGGLRAGRALFFGDFDDQALYARDGGVSLLGRAGAFASFRLRVNCRNLPGIAEEAAYLCGAAHMYGSYRRPADGSQPVIVTYTTAAEQAEQLVAAVRTLLADGFDLADIVVLSRYRKSAAALCTDGWLAPLLVDYRQGGPAHSGRVRYSTIHSFKGLEAPAVILTDLNESTRGPYHDLISVGVTRARDRLLILATPEGLAQQRSASPQASRGASSGFVSEVGGSV